MIVNELEATLFGCICNDGRYSRHCERCDNAIHSALLSYARHLASGYDAEEKLIDAQIRELENEE